MKLNIVGRSLTTLKNVDFPENVTILCCDNNYLTSLEHCPSTVTKLYCWNNQLTSLKYCPESVTKLDCGHNQLTSLEDCPSFITELGCSCNQLTSLKYCPESVTTLHCDYNQLTSLEHCPLSVTELDSDHNQLNDEYKNLSINEMHTLHKKKSFLKGLGIVQRITQDFKARKIQNAWRRWWYGERDEDGVSRFCKRSMDDFKRTLASF